ncbi:Y-family DNA polymerase [Leptospira kmetyi]|uniref:Y-family DNA polymerase n=1 Tax=Leptospira kmetyi TaxID=408139 RepID=UPI001FCC13B2|nr:Y-family DNA polymerase [Leptospira kmetyi]
MNNFYVSCERVFEPRLNHKAVVVLSNNDGCAVSRSAEAKALGINMSMPIFKAKDLVDSGRLIALSSNYALYGDMSHRFRSVLEDLCPEVEQYSIDECFLELTGFIKEDECVSFGKELREKIDQYLGLPVCVGIGETKTLAKVANRMAKTRPSLQGVCFLDERSREESLKSISPSEIWGVGPAYSSLLDKCGVKNALELCRLPDHWIRNQMTVVGLRLVYELRGVCCYDLELAPPPKKEIIVARAFGGYVSDLESVIEATTTYLSRAVEKLWNEDRYAQVITVSLRTDPFKTNQPQDNDSIRMEIPVATKDLFELQNYCIAGIKTIFKKGFGYKKSGVMLSEFTTESKQNDLFYQGRSNELTQVIIEINKKFKTGKIRTGATGFGPRAWRMKQDRATKCPTHYWKDIITFMV